MIGPRVGLTTIVAGCMAGDSGRGEITLILGQSNAVGQGAIGDVAATWGDPFPAVRLAAHIGIGAGVFSDYNGALDDRSGAFGAELSLGRAMPDRDIAICAMGGTSLATHWDPNGTYPAAGSGNLYHLAVTWAHTIEVSRGATVTSIIWMQGETDAANEANSLAYGDNLIEISGLLLAEFPRARFYYYRLPVNDVIQYEDNVRTGQTAAAGGSWMTMVNADAIALQDAVHFSSAGYLDLGTLFATTIKATAPRSLP